MWQIGFQYIFEKMITPSDASICRSSFCGVEACRHLFSTVSYFQSWLAMSMLCWSGDQGGEVRRWRSPHQFLQEGTDVFGLDESPCDSSDLNQLHGPIRSGHTLLGEEDGSRLLSMCSRCGESAQALESCVRELYFRTDRQQKQDHSC